LKLTIRHTFDFGGRIEELAGPEAWDRVRELDPRFAIPETTVLRPGIERRAGHIAAVARELGAGSICSYGVGTAELERALARDVRVTGTDFAPRTVERLQLLFPDAELVRHDLVRDEPLPADLHLLHRVDTELSDDEWRTVLPRFREPVLFVPSFVLGWGLLAGELVRRLRGATPAGYGRNEAALRALWAGSHDHRRIEIAGDPAYLLTPRRALPPRTPPRRPSAPG
jgi:hypothetical protein